MNVELECENMRCVYYHILDTSIVSPDLCVHGDLEVDHMVNIHEVQPTSSHIRCHQQTSLVTIESTETGAKGKIKGTSEW